MRSVDPYLPPAADVATTIHEHADDRRRGWLTSFAFIGFPLLFGIAGFAGYIALAFALEAEPTETESVLSYGQQAILISLPICTVLGASVGALLRSWLRTDIRLVLFCFLRLRSPAGVSQVHFGIRRLLNTVVILLRLFYTILRRATLPSLELSRFWSPVRQCDVAYVGEP